MGRFDSITSYLFGSNAESRQEFEEELRSIRDDVEHIDYLVSKSARLETAESEIERLQSAVESLQQNVSEDSEVYTEAERLETRLDDLTAQVEEKISEEDSSADDSHLVSTIDGVSPQLAKVLYDAGFETRSDVRNAREDELKGVEKIGDDIATQLATHNRIETGTVVSKDDGTFQVET